MDYTRSRFWKASGRLASLLITDMLPKFFLRGGTLYWDFVGSGDGKILIF